MQTAERCGLAKIYLPLARGPFAQKSGHSSKQPPKRVQHYGFMHNVEVWEGVLGLRGNDAGGRGWDRIRRD